jgi:hypothetical protein
LDTLIVIQLAKNSAFSKKQKFHYYLYKMPLPEPYLGHKNPLHILPRHIAGRHLIFFCHENLLIISSKINNIRKLMYSTALSVLIHVKEAESDRSLMALCIVPVSVALLGLICRRYCRVIKIVGYKHL